MLYPCREPRLLQREPDHGEEAGAHEAASAWIMEHPGETVQILQADNYAPGDPAVVTEVLKTYGFLVSDEQTETTLRNIIDDYRSFGFVDATRSTDELLARVCPCCSTNSGERPRKGGIT